MDERAFYRESQMVKQAVLNCPYCRTSNSYDLRWLVRRKIDKLPRQADERDPPSPGDRSSAGITVSALEQQAWPKTVCDRYESAGSPMPSVTRRHKYPRCTVAGQ